MPMLRRLDGSKLVMGVWILWRMKLSFLYTALQVRMCD